MEMSSSLDFRFIFLEFASSPTDAFALVHIVIKAEEHFPVFSLLFPLSAVPFLDCVFSTILQQTGPFSTFYFCISCECCCREDSEDLLK